jgi:transcriptional regulator with AAA-type ATPase domain
MLKVRTIDVRSMAFLSSREHSFLLPVSQLAYCNPFLPERSAYERAALGEDFFEGEPVWSIPVNDPERPRENVWRIVARLEPLVYELRERLASGVMAEPEELMIYEDAVLHLLYQHSYPKFFNASFADDRKPAAGRWRFYHDFAAGWRHFFAIDGVTFPSRHEPCHTFACFRQIQRAFEQIFRAIVGNSMPGARLRASVWQSVFTHDMRRYRRTLYERMGDFATLITGPSGSGKELVARAIGQSRYVPFDDRRYTFADDDITPFFPINISALSPALVESELFGHRRGSFTGAVADRKGWLETCPPLGSVFLDEFGDLESAIQVKLLRVIETRTFHPVGETAAMHFRGKLIAATNRDLSAAIANGQFREDLYYRLCSDQVVTPSLAEQLADSPGVIRELVVFITMKIAGAEGEELAQEVIPWIEEHLGPSYAWPGNYRELEQCVRNFLIRRDYKPAGSRSVEDAADALARDLRAGKITAEQLLERYCAIVYRSTGSYEETARRLNIDRRTVKSKVVASAKTIK